MIVRGFPSRVAIDPPIIITSVRDNSRLVPTCRVLYLPFAQRYTNFNAELRAYAPLSPPTCVRFQADWIYGRGTEGRFIDFSVTLFSISREDSTLN